MFLVRYIDERPDRLSTVTLVLPDLKRSTHSDKCHWFMVSAPYCANIQRWISIGLTHSAHRMSITMHCSSMTEWSIPATWQLCNATRQPMRTRGAGRQPQSCCFYSVISKLPLLSSSASYIITALGIIWSDIAKVNFRKSFQVIYNKIMLLHCLMDC